MNVISFQTLGPFPLHWKWYFLHKKHDGYVILENGDPEVSFTHFPPRLRDFHELICRWAVPVVFRKGRVESFQVGLNYGSM